MNEMNPGSFEFGPVWWAVFLAFMAVATVVTMCLFLWQASKEKAPRGAVHQRIDRDAEGRRLAPGTASRPTAIDRAA